MVATTAMTSCLSVSTGYLPDCTVHIYCDMAGQSPLPPRMQAALAVFDFGLFMALFEQCRAQLAACGGCPSGQLSQDGSHCVVADDCPPACTCGSGTIPVRCVTYMID